MLSPELTALLLKSSLPLRLALLDADPTGAGWVVYRAPTAGNPSRTVAMVATGLVPTHDVVKYGAAWIPCNPLAIVRHAVALYRQTRQVAECWPWVIETHDGKWAMQIRATHEPRTRVSVEHKCPHTAAVALLRAVVAP